MEQGIKRKIDDSNDNVMSEIERLNPVGHKASKRIRKQRLKTKLKNNKRGRLIVRNLSFKTTEKLLREHFERFGPISEVKLLKKPDGRLVGCGFVQFDVVQHAAKAIFQLSGKEFLGREIVCDWALGKDTYLKNMREAFNKEIKEENEVETIEIKEEEVDLSLVKDEIKTELDDSEIKSEKDSECSENEEIKEESEEEAKEDSEEEMDEVKEESEEEVEEIKENKPKLISNDVQEGKTIFIKNLPFSATNEDVKDLMSKFGPISYALVCIDKLTEYSKGTAFVKFQNLEDAEKCLETGTDLSLKGNVLECRKAISKADVDRKNDKVKIRNDSRHLYLIKEGVILAGTKAAQGVSSSDMAKRLELEKWKTQILKNLNMFISLYRLIIHNLPATYDDKQLRELFAKHVGPKSVIREAKVMRNLKQIGEDGKPISKEYGFVSFAKHEDALQALRAINNNPNIFTQAKRPIVAFSIENKSVLNAKKKRLIKSKVNNPNCKEFDPKSKQEDTKLKIINKAEVPLDDYSGLAAKPGTSNKLRSKHKLSTQAQLHFQNLKQEKRRMKLTRKSIKKKKEDYLKQAKQKKGKKKYKDDNFTKIENKYSKKFSKDKKNVKKQKWFES